MFTGPNIAKDGLVLAVDAANIKSFRGEPGTNILTEMAYIYGTQTGAYFKTSYGTETVNIPKIGVTTAHYCNIYNDYPASESCCPSLFRYGDVAVSANTSYTYQIIFRTNNGYVNDNYMYHYEYNTDTYLAEYGLYSGSRVEDLGDGWIHAWGTFTSHASANRFICYLFHYEYATYNKIEIAGVMLTPRSNVISYKHFIALNTTRGATVATGGGWKDLSIYSNNGQLFNAPTYSNYNCGSLVFNGSNQNIGITSNITVNPRTGSFTIIAWVNSDPSGGDNWDLWISKRSTGSNGFYIGANSPSGVRFMLGNDAGSRTDTGFISYTSNTWAMFTGVLNRDTNSQKIIRNNFEETSSVEPAGENYSNDASLLIGGEGGSYFVNGKIAIVLVYNKALSDSEITQNYNAYKSRFGL